MNYVRGEVPAGEVDLIVWKQNTTTTSGTPGCYVKKYESMDGAVIVWGGDLNWMLPGKYFADSSYGQWYSNSTLVKCAQLCMDDDTRCAAAMYFSNGSCIMKGFNYPTEYPDQYVMLPWWQWSNGIFVGTVQPTAANATTSSGGTNTSIVVAAIAGGVAGSVVLLAIAAVVGLVLWRRQQQNRVGSGTSEANRAGDSRGGGGEVWEAERVGVHEYARAHEARVEEARAAGWIDGEQRVGNGKLWAEEDASGAVGGLRERAATVLVSCSRETFPPAYTESDPSSKTKFGSGQEAVGVREGQQEIGC
ncbi:hypothetical protein DFJ73DRAFT_852698 [Zopfochytrium polystomum]|nr:hypothetical protein DFJ73DRAFT_852698 [Zopfochytrium polystomum]